MARRPAPRRPHARVDPAPHPRAGHLRRAERHHHAPRPHRPEPAPEPLRLGPSDDAEWAAFAAEAVLRAGDDTVLGDLSRERRTRAAIDLTWNAVAAEVAAATERAPETESAVLPCAPASPCAPDSATSPPGCARPPPATTTRTTSTTRPASGPACWPWRTRATPGRRRSRRVRRPLHPGRRRRARRPRDGRRRVLALAGAGPDACAAAACAELPEDTEIGRNARHALALAADAGSAFALVPSLEHQIVDHVYSYGVAAAETVPVALALTTAAGGRIAEAVPAAACLSRVADSAPALAGALTGALGGSAAIPASWRESCRTLSGCVLPGSPGRTWSNSPRCWKPPNRPHPEDDPGMNYEATEDAENTADTPSLDERITGALVGAAVGDALGGPVEGYSPSRSPSATAAASTVSSARGTAPLAHRPADRAVPQGRRARHRRHPDDPRPGPGVRDGPRPPGRVRGRRPPGPGPDDQPALDPGAGGGDDPAAPDLPRREVAGGAAALRARRPARGGRGQHRQLRRRDVHGPGRPGQRRPPGRRVRRGPGRGGRPPVVVRQGGGRGVRGGRGGGLRAGRDPDSVVAACLPLAKDGTREAVERVCEEASKHTDVESALRPLREAVAPYDTVGPDYRSPRWAPGVRPGCTRSRNSRSPWAWWWRPAATSGTPCWAR